VNSWFPIRDSKIIESTSYWFWIREVNASMHNMRVIHVHEEFLWMMLCFITPFVMLLSPLMALPTKHSVIDTINLGHGLTLYNKKNIEYFKVFETLKNGV